MIHTRVFTLKKEIISPVLLSFSLFLLTVSPIPCFSSDKNKDDTLKEVDWLADDIYSDIDLTGNTGSYDPLEPINRAAFAFNDKMYYWVLKPVNTGYRAVVARDLRRCITNFFDNLKSPIYVLNNLFQGKFKQAGIVVLRFAVNSSIGVIGLGDPAKNELKLRAEREDFGQTLGYWGAGEGFYICWPFLGPSNIRDTFGLLVDGVVSPLSHITTNGWSNVGRYSTEKINQLSFQPTLYDDLKKYSLDPYVTVRQAFNDYRYEQIAGNNQSQDKKQQTALIDLGNKNMAIANK